MAGLLSVGLLSVRSWFRYYFVVIDSLCLVCCQFIVSLLLVCGWFVVSYSCHGFAVGLLSVYCYFVVSMLLVCY